MKTKMLVATLFAALSAVSAETVLDVNGAFATPGKNGLPKDWMLHDWQGYLPLAKVTAVNGPDGRRALQIAEVTAQHGTCLRNYQKFPCKAGDTVRISFLAKGKGKARCGCYLYTEKNGWNAGTPEKGFVLSDEWRLYEYDCLILDRNTGKTAKAELVIGGEKGLEATVCDVRVAVERTPYPGSQTFPKSWTCRLTEEDRGQNVEVALQGAELDFAKLLAPKEQGFFGSLAAKFKKAEAPVVWAFATIDAVCDCEYSIGAGAEGAVSWRVNGETVLDAKGMSAEPSFADETKSIRLKAGKNEFAICYRPASGATSVQIGGASELRALRPSVAVVKTLRQDNYEKPAKRSGEPELVQGHVAPGLLNNTWMGWYRTSDRAVIEMPGERYRLPDGKDEVFSASYRLYGFGRNGQRLPGRLTEAFAVGKKTLEMSVVSMAGGDILDVTFATGGATLGSFRVPTGSLPADFRVDLSRGEVAVTVTSLSDSSVRRHAFATPFFAAAEEFRTALALVARGAPTEVVLDERTLSVGKVSVASGRVPYKVDLLGTFDPVKAGWPLIFEDDFEGTALNTNKWYFPHYAGQHKECFTLDGKGHLRLTADWDEKKPGKLKTDGIWSSVSSTYGYFVARLKFTQAPGWWAAFWLYGPQNNNPFLDGFEIDIFEDYYTRAKPGQQSRKILDHNNHVNMGGLTKSWNYNSVLPRGVYDWYELGCKWTPFEISYYLDGKLIASSASHSDYKSVTFDAIQHFAGLSPLHAIVSGQVMRNPSIPIDPKQIPETYEVDWVRIYAYPDPPGESPAIAWAGAAAKDAVMQQEGTRLRFDVDATPGAKTKSPVKAVYLFDNGYLVDYRTKPPYQFEIPFTDAFYQTTRYMKAGRSGTKPVFDSYPHVFVAYAQDASGKVSHTAPLLRIPVAPKAAPYEGKAQAIPGVISSIRFDEGGFGTSCYTKDKKNKHWAPTRKDDGVTASKNGWIGTIYAGDWLNYTVDVKEAGRYHVKARLHFGIRGKVAATLLLDGVKVGRFVFDGVTYWRQETDAAGDCTVELPAGRHVLTFVSEGGLSYKELVFEKEGK